MATSSDDQNDFDRPLRVLHVVPGLAASSGGPAVNVVESSLALKRRGVAVSIFSTDMVEPASAKRHTRIKPVDMAEGAEALDIHIFRARSPYRFSFAPSLHGALRKSISAFDLVHVHTLYLFPQYAVSRLAPLHRVPYIVSPRGALDPYIRNHGRLRKAIAGHLWHDRFLATAARIHVTTEDEGLLMTDVAPAVPRTVVPNGITWQDYQDLPGPREFRQRFLPDTDGPIVMNLGRISEKKKHDVLILAFARVAARVPDSRLVLVGPDDEGLVPGLRSLAEREGVGDAVIFTGMLRGRDKLAALAAATVWALPSSSENFGNAVVEALAAGIPTIVSPAVNISSDIEAAGCGIVCEASPEPLATQILALLTEPVSARDLAAKGRAFARRYDWDNVAAALESMYRDVLGWPDNSVTESRGAFSA